MPGWLSDYSEPPLRAALRAAAPHLADLPLSLDGAPDLDRPTWATGRATIDGRIYAKFAFSERTAVRIWREAQVLEVLHELGLRVPEPAASGRDPAFSATFSVGGGSPLAYEDVATAATERVAAGLATFLAGVHAERTLERVRARVERLIRLPDPILHVTVDDLRARFPALVEPQHRQRVLRWLDWADDELARPAGTVFVHGDFHPYNQLWELAEPRLLAVVDLENAGLAEPEYDFRVLPAYGPGVGLLVSTVEQYEALSGRTLSLRRIMALHVVNHLGDALWRTEKGVDLQAPGRTPSGYVEETIGRLDALGLDV